LGATVHVDVVSMMVNMIFMIALPALAGMVVNDLTHGWGRSKLSPALSPASKLLLIVIITSNSTGMADSMRHLTPELVGAAAFILVFAVSGYLWGFLAARALDRPLPDLVTICFDCGLRNISSGAVIAAAFFPGEVMFPVMCGTLFQQVIAAGFGSRMRALVASEAERNEATCERARLSMTSAEKTADDGQGSGPKE
jgi:predicted Na+-dependent transporter